MDLLYDIKNAKNDEEIKIIIDEIIKVLTDNSNIMNSNETIIGPKINTNPSLHLLTKEYETITQEYKGYYLGFIPKGTKLIYGTVTSLEIFSQYCAGWYYYIDDFSYIYEFAKYIKNKKVCNQFNLVDYVYTFLKDYYTVYLNPKERDEIHKLILKDKYSYYNPINEHSNKDFVKNGAALCSEFSSAANNILNVFGIECIYLQDTNHAYNIFSIPNDDDKDIMDYYLLDSTIRVFSYDIDSDRYDDEAYIEYIPDFNETDLYEFLRGEKDITTQDYFMVHDDNKYFRMYIDNERKYSIQTDYYFEFEDLVLNLIQKK